MGSDTNHDTPWPPLLHTFFFTPSHLYWFVSVYTELSHLIHFVLLLVNNVVTVHVVRMVDSLYYQFTSGSTVEIRRQKRCHCSRAVPSGSAVLPLRSWILNAVLVCFTDLLVALDPCLITRVCVYHVHWLVMFNMRIVHLSIFSLINIRIIDFAIIRYLPHCLPSYSAYISVPCGSMIFSQSFQARCTKIDEITVNDKRKKNMKAPWNSMVQRNWKENIAYDEQSQFKRSALCTTYLY